MDDPTKWPEPATGRNIRVQARYDALMSEGKHGHYETMFQVVREEVEQVCDAAETAEDRRDVRRQALGYAVQFVTSRPMADTGDGAGLFDIAARFERYLLGGDDNKLSTL